MTSDSQITVLEALREKLGVGPGDRIQFVPAWSGFRRVVTKGDIRSLRSVLEGRRRKPLSLNRDADSLETLTFDWNAARNAGVRLLN